MHVQWQAVDEAGQNRQGEMQSMSLALARAQLRRQGLQVTRLKRLWWRPVPRIHLRDTAQVTRQLATLLQAGVPLLQALDMLMHGMPQVAWREPLQDIASQVMAGRSLHEALARHPRIFSPLYRHMVAAGEMAGALDQTLLRLADTLERNERLQARLRAALMYPAIVLCVALAVVMLIMLWVVPVFEEVFRAFGASLPLPTQILIELSHGLAQAGLPLLLFGVMAVSGSRQPAVRRRLATWSDQWLPRLPLIGALLKLSVLARWCQTLSSLLAAGIPLAEALGTTGQACGHPAYQRATQRLVRSVSQGGSLHRAMAGQPRFPVMLAQMCATGEETGSLEQMLQRAGDWFAADFETRVEGLGSLLEPLIIVVLGLAIGGILVAMYLPIFQLGQVF